MPHRLIKLIILAENLDFFKIICYPGGMCDDMCIISG